MYKEDLKQVIMLNITSELLDKFYPYEVSKVRDNVLTYYHSKRFDTVILKLLTTGYMFKNLYDNLPSENVKEYLYSNDFKIDLEKMINENAHVFSTIFRNFINLRTKDFHIGNYRVNSQNYLLLTTLFVNVNRNEYMLNKEDLKEIYEQEVYANNLQEQYNEVVYLNYLSKYVYDNIAEYLESNQVYSVADLDNQSSGIMNGISIDIQDMFSPQRIVKDRNFTEMWNTLVSEFNQGIAFQQDESSNRNSANLEEVYEFTRSLKEKLYSLILNKYKKDYSNSQFPQVVEYTDLQSLLNKFMSIDNNTYINTMTHIHNTYIKDRTHNEPSSMEEVEYFYTKYLRKEFINYVETIDYRFKTMDNLKHTMILKNTLGEVKNELKAFALGEHRYNETYTKDSLNFKRYEDVYKKRIGKSELSISLSERGKHRITRIATILSMNENKELLKERNLTKYLIQPNYEFHVLLDTPKNEKLVIVFSPNYLLANLGINTLFRVDAFKFEKEIEFSVNGLQDLLNKINLPIQEETYNTLKEILIKSYNLQYKNLVLTK